MHTVISLLVDQHPIAVERILQVTRYRGFNLVGLTLSPTSDSRQQISLEITSDRNSELLVNQLAKIYHVLELTVGANLRVAEPQTQPVVQLQEQRG